MISNSAVLIDPENPPKKHKDGFVAAYFYVQISDDDEACNMMHVPFDPQQKLEVGKAFELPAMTNTKKIAAGDILVLKCVSAEDLACAAPKAAPKAAAKGGKRSAGAPKAPPAKVEKTGKKQRKA